MNSTDHKLKKGSHEDFFDENGEPNMNPKSNHRGFNINSFRVDSQAGMNDLSSQLVNTSKVIVRIPYKDEAVRVIPGEDYRLETLGAFDDDGKCYLPAPEMRSHFAGTLRPIYLVTAVREDGGFIIIPTKLDRFAGRPNTWNASLRECIHKLEAGWGVIKRNHVEQCYEFEAKDIQIDFAIPPEDFSSILAEGFDDDIITSEDHPFIKDLAS